MPSLLASSLFSEIVLALIKIRKAIAKYRAEEKTIEVPEKEFGFESREFKEFQKAYLEPTLHRKLFATSDRVREIEDRPKQAAVLGVDSLVVRDRIDPKYTLGVCLASGPGQRTGVLVDELVIVSPYLRIFSSNSFSFPGRVSTSHRVWDSENS